MFVIQIDAGLFFCYVMDAHNATQVREDAKQFVSVNDARAFIAEHIHDGRLPCKIEEA